MSSPSMAHPTVEYLVRSKKGELIQPPAPACPRSENNPLVPPPHLMSSPNTVTSTSFMSVSPSPATSNSQSATMPAPQPLSAPSAAWAPLPAPTGIAGVPMMTSVHWASESPNATTSLSTDRTATTNVSKPWPAVQIAASGLSLSGTAAGGPLAASPATQPVPVPSFNMGVSSPKARCSSNSNDSNARSCLRSVHASSSSPTDADISPTNGGGPGGVGGSLNNRRQKRLERNRESARLSRRRRKQYLEVLEERVAFLSNEVDRGRRDHVSSAITTVRRLREEKLDTVERELGLNFADLCVGNRQQQHPEPPIIQMLEQHVDRPLAGPLCRTSDELRVATTFEKEQLKGFTLSPSNKFVLWLTLQTDVYFRGGRAASERLSAARIGERMLSSGHDRVNPSSGMWPLLCNEISLSYDQEERVRNFQKTLLSNHDSWLHRHAANASDHALQSAHAAILGLSEAMRRREQATMNILNVEQRLKFMAWARRRAETIARLIKSEHKNSFNFKSDSNHAIKPSPETHDAVNLYIINHQLNTVAESLPTPSLLVPACFLKKLSRRPSFESLASQEQGQAPTGQRMSSDGSFPSTGSLKRTNSEISCDEMDVSDSNLNHNKPQSTLQNSTTATPTVTPVAAQLAAAPIIEAVLGSVMNIIPPPPQPTELPISVKKASSAPSQLPHHQQQQQQHEHYDINPAPVKYFEASQASPSCCPLTYPLQHMSAPVTVAAPAPIPETAHAPMIYAPVLPMSVSASMPLDTHNIPVPALMSYYYTIDPAFVAQAPLPMAQAQTPLPLPGPHATNPFPISVSAPALSSTNNDPGFESILPSHMNIVPEDGCLVAGQSPDDFLLEFAEEDWAIGEGFDMEVL